MANSGFGHVHPTTCVCRHTEATDRRDNYMRYLAPLLVSAATAEEEVPPEAPSPEPSSASSPPCEGRQSANIHHRYQMKEFMWRSPRHSPFLLSFRLLALLPLLLPVETPYIKHPRRDEPELCLIITPPLS